MENAIPLRAGFSRGIPNRQFSVFEVRQKSCKTAWQVRSMQRRHLTPMTTVWRTPVYALKGVRHHWPNPFDGTIGVKGPFNEMPRLPFQLGNCLLRTINYFRRRPKILQDS